MPGNWQSKPYQSLEFEDLEMEESKSRVDQGSSVTSDERAVVSACDD